MCVYVCVYVCVSRCPHPYPFHCTAYTPHTHSNVHTHTHTHGISKRCERQTGGQTIKPYHILRHGSEEVRVNERDRLLLGHLAAIVVVEEED